MKNIKESTFKNKVKRFLERNKLDINDPKSGLVRNKQNQKAIQDLKVLAIYFQHFYPELGRQKCQCQQNINDFINVLKVYTKKNFKSE